MEGTKQSQEAEGAAASPAGGEESTTNTSVQITEQRNGDGDEEAGTEHNWFFEKEFFEEVHKEESEAQCGEKRKLGDENEDEDDEAEITGEKQNSNTAERVEHKKGHYACYECGALVPNVEYSKRQRRKKTKRRMKCKRCMAEAVGKNVSTEPLSAAELYRMNLDRFIEG